MSQSHRLAMWLPMVLLRGLMFITGASCRACRVITNHIRGRNIRPNRLLAIPILRVHLSVSEASKDSEIGRFNFLRRLPAPDVICRECSSRSLAALSPSPFQRGGCALSPAISGHPPVLRGGRAEMGVKSKQILRQPAGN